MQPEVITMSFEQSMLDDISRGYSTDIVNTYYIGIIATSLRFPYCDNDGVFSDSVIKNINNVSGVKANHSEVKDYVNEVAGYINYLVIMQLRAFAPMYQITSVEQDMLVLRRM